MGYVLPGGVESVHIVTVPGVQLFPPDGSVSTTPDFVSGAVVEKNILILNTEQQVLIVGQPEVQSKTQLVIAGFYPTLASAQVHHKELHQGKNQITRLAVDPFSGFEDTSHDWGVRWSQCFSVMPGMYSGQMRSVVQFLLGVGRRPYKKSVYDSKPFKTKVTAPTDVNYLQQVRANGLQIHYDFRFLRTHGIVSAADGRLWLVEISQAKGILAMPLPLEEITTTPEFYKRTQDAGDTDAQRVIEAYGGFPSGEYFPPPEMLQAYIRAGRVLQLLPAASLAEFYACGMYSSAMGWAFNSRGTEAHNTAYYFHDDHIQRGVHYAIQMHIGASTIVPTDSRAKALKGAFARLSNDDRFKGTFEANMWKLDHMSKAALDSYQASVVGKALDLKYIALDQLVVGAIASGSASCAKLSEGKIFWPTRRGQPQVKYPEPLLGYLLSHDMRPEIGASAHDKGAARCDTIMHVFFAQDELKWAKVFNDQRTYGDATFTGDNVGDSPTNTWDYDFEYNYLPAGNFERHQSRGPYGIPAMIYTSDFDDRRTLGTIETNYIFKRKSLGYYEILSFAEGAGDRSANPGTFMDDRVDPPVPGGDAQKSGWRNKWFQWDSWEHEVDTPQLRAAVAVPFFDREAMYYAKFEANAQVIDRVISNRVLFTDPNVVRLETIYTDDGRFDHTEVADQHRIRGSAYTDNYHRDWYDEISSFMDEGEWLANGSNFTAACTKANIPPVNHWSRATTTVTGGAGTNTIQFVSSVIPQPMLVKTQTRTDIDAGLWEPFWYIPSPDPDTDLTAYIAETPNCLGDAEIVIYQKDINDTSGSNGVLGVGPPGVDLTKTIPTFVGVLN